jgi:hypothetical protein
MNHRPCLDDHTTNWDHAVEVQYRTAPIYWTDKGLKLAALNSNET